MGRKDSFSKGPARQITNRDEGWAAHLEREQVASDDGSDQGQGRGSDGGCDGPDDVRGQVGRLENHDKAPNVAVEGDEVHPGTTEDVGQLGDERVRDGRDDGRRNGQRGQTAGVLLEGRRRPDTVARRGGRLHRAANERVETGR